MDSEEDKGYSGQRYLQDMKQERQYIVTYENSAPRKDVVVFTPEGSAALEPGKTVSALDDEVRFKEGREGKTIMRTLAFEITAGDDGRARDVGAMPVEFVVECKAEDDRLDIHLQLTEGSAEALSEVGMDVPALWEMKFSRPLKEAQASVGQDGKLNFDGGLSAAFALPARYHEKLFHAQTERDMAVRRPLSIRKDPSPA